uniref:Rhodanese-like domain-containing protein n=1 Tax=Roseihalotalea indica TaxID=2867963 RepID=A0AA49JCC6_9BACT|nr:rhodanese-like domain-containing protein [Tunicatimonas sp. TK19036]
MFNLFEKRPQNYHAIGPEEFNALKARKGHVVLDVRSPQEARDGSIQGGIQINFFDPHFRSKLEKLDKSQAYLVYCRSGNRSAQACSLMADLGFDQLYNLSGGINAWKAYAQNS